MKSRIMFIEPGGGLGAYNARIGLVTFSKTGKSIRYRGQEFRSLQGAGYKTHYFDVNTGEEYWISGPKKNGEDALYPLDIEIDEDVREEYWTKIRNRPDLVSLSVITQKVNTRNVRLILNFQLAAQPVKEQIEVVII